MSLQRVGEERSAITSLITAVTASITAVMASITADTALRRADVWTPEWRRLQGSSASDAATRQAWRVTVGVGACRCWQQRRRQPPGVSFHHPIQGLAGRKILTLVTRDDTWLTVNGALSAVRAGLTRNTPEVTKTPLIIQTPRTPQGSGRARRSACSGRAEYTI